MRLNDYITKHKVSPKLLAKKIGVSVSAISRWRKGNRKIPQAHTIERITKATNGKVTLKDWKV